MTEEYIPKIKTDMTYEQFLKRYAALKFQKTGGHSTYIKGKMIGDLSPDKKEHVACSTGKIHPTKAIFILADGREVGVPQKTFELYNESKPRTPRTRGSTAPTW